MKKKKNNSNKNNFTKEKKSKENITKDRSSVLNDEIYMSKKNYLNVSHYLGNIDFHKK